MIPMSLREQISLLLFLLVVLAICGLELFLLARYSWDRMRRRPGTRTLHSRPAIVLHALAAVVIICLLYGYFIEPYWIDVNVMTIRTAKLKNAGFRIVQISDLHCDEKPRNEEETLRIVNGLKPDIIVATGDYLNQASALPRLQEMLSRLEAPLGKFAVTGNFEAHRRRALDMLDGTGFRWLERETVLVAKGADNIGIFGMDFVRSEGLRESIPDFPSDRFDIFLFHTPDLIEDVNGLGIDLYLCGHTHGGQVALPGYGALITFSKFGKKYESGLYQVGETTLYVNRGLGMEPSPGPPVRFLARPEIAVFDIVPEQQ
jgi:predicted MPP superfamily phosphohydrolase